MTDIYSTDVLMKVVEDLKLPGTSILNRFFPIEQAEESEEIHFDIMANKRRVAPFVHPHVAGRVVDGAGRQTATFKPAYVKDKRPIDPNKPLKRAVGERIGGALSAAEREQVYIVGELEDQLKMLTRREELMAVEALLTGKVVVKGEGYPTVTVDFGRDPALTPTALSSTARWGESAADPLANLRTWAGLTQQKSGVYARDVIMDATTLAKFIANADVKARLDQRHITNVSMAIDSSDEEGLAAIGTIDGFRIWSYSGWYVDPETDTEGTILPAGKVIMSSPLVEGVRAYGAIRDPRANYIATRYYAKSWIDEDPARRFLMMQSAPLMVPTRVNASLGVQVHG